MGGARALSARWEELFEWNSTVGESVVITDNQRAGARTDTIAVPPKPSRARQVSQSSDGALEGDASRSDGE